jgi:hypothetical protein
MSVPPPPSSRLPRRPWYLVVALAFCFLFGSGGAMRGCQTFAMYRGELSSDFETKGIAAADARDRVQKAFDELIDASYQAKNRLYPVGVASWVLGMAMLSLGARALGGQRAAHRYLLQVLIAQTALTIVAFFLTEDVSRAETNFVLVKQQAMMPPDADDPTVRALVSSPTLWQALSLGWLVIRVLMALGVLFALTRERARAFYDAVSPRSMPE